MPGYDCTSKLVLLMNLRLTVEEKVGFIIVWHLPCTANIAVIQ